MTREDQGRSSLSPGVERGNPFGPQARPAQISRSMEQNDYDDDQDYQDRQANQGTRHQAVAQTKTLATAEGRNPVTVTSTMLLRSWTLTVPGQ